MRPAYIRFTEDEGVHDRLIDVCFGGEVDDRIDIVILDGCAYGIDIADIALNEGKMRVGLQIGHIFEAASVGELIEYDDPVVAILFEHIANEIAPDEAGTTGDQQIAHCLLPSMMAYHTFASLAYPTNVSMTFALLLDEPLFIIASNPTGLPDG
jgi:hypothetical protein